MAIGQAVLPPFSDEDLSRFLKTLKDRGYRVGPEQLLSIQMLLARLAERDALPSDPHAFPRFIGPIVCTTPRQQAEFSRIFDVWLGSLDPGPAPAPVSVPDDRVFDEQARALRRRVMQARLISIGAAVSLVALLLLLYGPSSAPLFGGSGSRDAFRSVDMVTALGAIMIVGALFAIAAMMARRRFLARREEQHSRGTTSMALSMTPESSWVPHLPRDVIVRMRRRDIFETEELDLEATVRASCQNAGQFDPRYVVGSRIPEYLVLIEATTSEDLRAHRATAVTDALTKEQVFVDRYYFDCDPRAVTERLDLGERATLNELATRHPLHRLIVCSEGEGMISGLTGLPHSWMSLLSRWSDRSLLTLAPVADWGSRERALSSTGLRTLPCTPDGFGAVADVRLARRVISDGGSVMPPRYPSDLLDDDMEWTVANQPSRARVREAIVRVHDYLGETGFRWLSSCAVYPEVKAPLTLKLGNRIARPFEVTILERLARLPWMRQAYMPDWFRMALLDALDRDGEKLLRTHVKGLLDAPKCGSVLEVVVRKLRDILAMTMPWRYGWDDSRDSGDPLRDRVYMGWMDERLAVRIPAALWRWLGSQGSRASLSSENLSPDTARYFSARHAIPFRGVVALVGGLLLTGLIGYSYGIALTFVESYRFFSLVKPIIALVAWILVGVIASELIVKVGHIRGRWYGRAVGGIAVALYLLVKLDVKFDHGFDLRDPIGILSTIYSSPEFGWGSYTVWALELLLLVLFTAIVLEDSATAPFCPRCRTWTSTRKRLFGPLNNEEVAVRDMLFGRFWRFYALSRTAADRLHATSVTVEHCQTTCLATTLVSVSRRTSTRSGGGVGSNVDEPLVSRLYVNARAGAELTEWVSATTSIRPNLVPDSQPELQRVVTAILPLTDDLGSGFYVYGEIPANVAAKARLKMAGLSAHEIAAIAVVSDFWLIVNFYTVIVFTESTIYLCGTTPAEPILYEDMRKHVTGSDADAIAYLKKCGISEKPNIMLRLIRRLLE